MLTRTELIENIRVSYNLYGSISGKALVFLHGFSGSKNDWIRIARNFEDKYFIIVPDLVGHGESDSPLDVNFYTEFFLIKVLKSIIEKLNVEKIILYGYSMGGRLAFAFQRKYPDLVEAMILESTTPGIESQKERFVRKRNDNELADRIEKNGLEWFVDFWVEHPIFATQKKLPILMQNQIKENKLQNNPVGISNSLRGFSTGKMNSYWEHLNNLSVPVKIFAGSEDTKYHLISKRLAQKIKNSNLIIFKNVGHNVHLERPNEITKELKKFISKIWSTK